MNFLTELREGLAISWSAIRANKLRSVLTTLGIVIGIVTVTLMGTAIRGLNNSFLNSISSIGADVLYVDRSAGSSNRGRNGLKAMKKSHDRSLEEAAALQRQMKLAWPLRPSPGRRAGQIQEARFVRRARDGHHRTISNHQRPDGGQGPVSCPPRNATAAGRCASSAPIWPRICLKANRRRAKPFPPTAEF
jgi:hypothetical protein